MLKIFFTEINTNLPIVLKAGRFGEYTEFDGFNKATKLKPEDKPANPKIIIMNRILLIICQNQEEDMYSMLSGYLVSFQKG